MTKTAKPKKPVDPNKPIIPALAPGKKPWHKGRAPTSSDQGPSAALYARVGVERLIKFHRLGGAAWLRALLDAIPMPRDHPK